jgi:hypothetical protein
MLRYSRERKDIMSRRPSTVNPIVSYPAGDPGRDSITLGMNAK